MAMLVTDCPRCGADSITFDVLAAVHTGQEYDWLDHYEVFCTCRKCNRPTIFYLSLDDYNARPSFRGPSGLVNFDNALNRHFKVRGYVSQKEYVDQIPPEHVPEKIAKAFQEAVVCFAVECYNAAGAMFRLCIDLATKPLLPDPTNSTITQPNAKQRRDLGLRLSWLFDNDYLSSNLRELAKCIREDGNDGAHAGSLTKEDVEDLLDFTTALLERLFTEPRRLELAQERRTARRTPRT